MVGQPMLKQKMNEAGGSRMLRARVSLGWQDKVAERERGDDKCGVGRGDPYCRECSQIGDIHVSLIVS